MFRELALEMLRESGWPEDQVRAMERYIAGDLSTDKLTAEQIVKLDAAMRELEPLLAQCIAGLTTTH
jgi:hypothetical protein